MGEKLLYLNNWILADVRKRHTHTHIYILYIFESRWISVFFPRTFLKGIAI